jgi:multidrug resistance efflux pump
MTRIILPTIAVPMFMLAVGHAWYIQRPTADVSPPLPPPTASFSQTIAGVGKVEPASDASGTGTITVGSQQTGVVTKVLVRPGQNVKAGELLFELDKRSAEAEVKVRAARRSELLPRKEDVPPSEANVQAAEANFKQQQDLYQRHLKLATRQACAPQELESARQGHDSSRAQLVKAQAELALLKAGAWKPDLDVSTVNVEQARAQLEQAKVQLDLLDVRALSDGVILQVNVRPGEYVANVQGQSLIVMGNAGPLQIRANVDEEDLPRLKLNARAIAKIRGSADQEEMPLRFVRLEPNVIPKTSLTGTNSERVDTRVIQLIYQVDRPGLWVGQVVDVFLDVR